MSTVSNVALLRFRRTAGLKHGLLSNGRQNQPEESTEVMINLEGCLRQGETKLNIQ